MSLEAAARAAYRDLWRASRVTFTGDRPVLNAFREKMRIDAAVWKAETDEASLQQSLQGARDVAQFLRRNVAQMQKLPEKDADGNEVYRVRLTEFSERGDNNANRNPKSEAPEPSARRQRKLEKQQQSGETQVSQGSPGASPTAPRNYSQLKRAHKERKMPTLREEDLEEKFVRGSGPGGQSINKTQNNVQLVHKPTGIRVICQETRSLEQNRKIARRILLDKLDQLANPGLSKSEMQKAKQLERERRRRKKAKTKARRETERNDADRDNNNATVHDSPESLGRS